MTRLSDLIREGGSERVSRHTVLTDLFEEEPVDLRTFVQDRKFLGNPPLSDPQYEAVRHIEQIYLPELYPLMVEEFGDYWKPVRFINFATLEWGKGSGKDHICRVASLRAAYLLLCLRSPQEYFGIPEQDSIHLLNVASSAGQAFQAYFKPLTRAVKRGWFQDRCHPTTNAIVWDKNVEQISGHSDPETLEGLNLMVGIADEIDAFKSTDEVEARGARGLREPTRSADAILGMLRTSSATRFPRNYKVVAISYPRFVGSTIQKLRIRGEDDVKAKGAESKHYVSGPLATWDVNPRVSGPEDFAEDYEKDPILAAAKYECRPSKAIRPYFRDTDLLDSCAVECHEQPLTIEYDRVTQNGVPVWVPVFKFRESFVAREGARYAMHGDIGITQDRAGIGMAHVSSWQERSFFGSDEDGGLVEMAEQRPVVDVDFVASFSADLTADPPREVQVRWYRMLCAELRRRGFNVRRYTFDGFQSVDSLQILSTWGIDTARLSLDMSDEGWRNLRDLMVESRVSWPASARLRAELEGLQRLNNGKVDHPPGGSKDEADALAGAVVGALLLGGQETGREATPGNAEFYTGGGVHPMGFAGLASLSDKLPPGLLEN